MATKPKPQICIVTVIGQDKVGIIASLSNAMAKANVNILDVSQKIMQDHFVMMMSCDISQASLKIEKIQEKLDKIADRMGLTITLCHENIYKKMHRI